MFTITGHQWRSTAPRPARSVSSEIQRQDGDGGDDASISLTAMASLWCQMILVGLLSFAQRNRKLRRWNFIQDLTPFVFFRPCWPSPSRFQSISCSLNRPTLFVVDLWPLASPTRHTLVRYRVCSRRQYRYRARPRQPSTNIEQTRKKERWTGVGIALPRGFAGNFQNRFTRNQFCC